MFSVVDLRWIFVLLSMDPVKLRYRAYRVLDEGAVAQVECQVGYFVCHGLSLFTALNRHHGHCRQSVCQFLKESENHMELRSIQELLGTHQYIGYIMKICFGLWIAA